MILIQEGAKECTNRQAESALKVSNEDNALPLLDLRLNLVPWDSADHTIRDLARLAQPLDLPFCDIGALPRTAGGGLLFSLLVLDILLFLVLFVLRALLTAGNSGRRGIGDRLVGGTPEA